MSITHTISRTWAGQNSTPISPPAQSFTGSEELNLDFVLPANTSNQQANLAFTKSLLQEVFIYSDTSNITVKTNSSSAPQDTFNLVSGAPLAWDVNCALANPFAGNVTTAYFTNSTTSNTNVKLRCLTNG